MLGVGGDLCGSSSPTPQKRKCIFETFVKFSEW